MKRLSVMILVMFFVAGILAAQESGTGSVSSQKPVKTVKTTKKVTKKVSKKITKKVVVKEVKGKDRIAVMVTKEDVTFATSGSTYCIQPESISSAGYMMYFAAKDETADKELLVKKLQKTEVKIDSPDIKFVNASFALGDQNNIDPNYRLDLQLEVKKGFPMLAVNSKFVYLGEGTHKCVINWGVSNAASSPRNKFKYYQMPKEGKLSTFHLAAEGASTKIGYAKWICANDGRGNGVGLICPSMIGKGDDFIFINSVPPEKELSANQSSDVFFLFMPIHKNVKLLDSLYSQAFAMKWFE